MRLVCQIDRAIRRIEDDPVTRLLRPNYCENQTTTYSVAPSRPATGADLVDGERRMTLRTSNEGSGLRLHSPLQDTGWSDNALVDYHYIVPFRGNGVRLRFNAAD